MNGHYGKILNINLSDQTFKEEPIEEAVYTKYLGGKGLASYLLFERNPPGVDPMSPENCLIFATGPITGSRVWGSSRYGVFTKAPQPGIYAESYSGGRVEIKGLAGGGGGVIQVRRGSAEMKELEEQIARELDVFNVEAEALQGELRRLKDVLFH